MNGRTREGFYTLWTIAILLCLGACVFVLAYVSIVHGTVEGDPQAEATTEPSPQPEDASLTPEDGYVFATELPTAVTAEPLPPSTTLAETPDAGQEYQDKIVFLGDSTTYGLLAYNVLPYSQVWVPHSGTLSLFNWEVETVDCYPVGATSGAEARSIRDAAASIQPEYLVITLGLNGIAILDESSFKDYYRGLVTAIQQASPSTKIICNTIFPVVDSMTSQDINNASINSANGWILDIAEETGTRYMNSHDAFTDSTGNLPGSLQSGDGIHLMPDGYNQFLQFVRTHAYQ